jgi:hypothetical protein
MLHEWLVYNLFILLSCAVVARSRSFPTRMLFTLVILMLVFNVAYKDVYYTSVQTANTTEYTTADNKTITLYEYELENIGVLFDKGKLVYFYIVLVGAVLFLLVESIGRMI